MEFSRIFQTSLVSLTLALLISGCAPTNSFPEDEKLFVSQSDLTASLMTSAEIPGGGRAKLNQATWTSFNTSMTREWGKKKGCEQSNNSLAAFENANLVASNDIPIATAVGYWFKQYVFDLGNAVDASATRETFEKSFLDFECQDTVLEPFNPYLVPTMPKFDDGYLEDTIGASFAGKAWIYDQPTRQPYKKFWVITSFGRYIMFVEATTQRSKTDTAGNPNDFSHGVARKTISKSISRFVETIESAQGKSSKSNIKAYVDVGALKASFLEAGGTCEPSEALDSSKVTVGEASVLKGMEGIACGGGIGIFRFPSIEARDYFIVQVEKTSAQTNKPVKMIVGSDWLIGGPSLDNEKFAIALGGTARY